MSNPEPKWKSGSVDSRLSRKALAGGTDIDGATIHVGRATINDVTMTAKIIHDRKSAYVCYNGAEIFVSNFEVLCGKQRHFTWVPASHGSVPDRAVQTGTDNGEAIFVGRAPFESTMTVGKVHPSHAAIYIPFNGVEIRLPDYEVLVYTKKPSRRSRRRERRRKRREDSSSSSSSSSDD